jgi:hypothetical protein
MKWMWLSIAPAVTILPSPAITSVAAPTTRLRIHAVHAYPDYPPSRSSRCGRRESRYRLHDAPVVDDQRVGDHQVERALLGFALGRRALTHAVANHLAAAEGDLVAVDGVIFLNFDDQLGIGQANAVSGGGP